MNKVNFNIKGVIYGAIVMILIIGGFIVIPNMFMEQSKPVDYTILQREAIPEKILDMMDKYVNIFMEIIAFFVLHFPSNLNYYV